LIYLGGLPIAEIDRVSPTYFHTDATRSVRVVTSSTGAVKGVTDYSNYGVNFSTATTELSFTGHHFDSETGLLYANARYYSPKLGRFISSDFVDPLMATGDSMNRFAYGLNDPTMYWDPTGNEGELFRLMMNDLLRIQFIAQAHGAALDGYNLALLSSQVGPEKTAPWKEALEYKHRSRLEWLNTGRALGSTTAVVAGSIEAVGSFVAMAGALFGEGVAIPETMGASVATMEATVAIGTAGVVHGVNMAANGAKEVGSSTSDLYSQMSGNGNGKGAGIDSRIERGICTEEAKNVKITKEMHSTSEIMRPGSKIDKVERLKELFGGRTSDWTKRKTWDASGAEIHYYSGPNGMNVGIKFTGQNDPTALMVQGYQGF
jgi:RHS repeat-associated protein